MMDEKALVALIDMARDMGLAFARSRNELPFEEKSPGQFASLADREIERAIRESLATGSEPISIIGEEGGGSLDNQTSGWAIDPIDGTSNFMRGLPLWGISVGYLHRGTSVLGAVTLPELALTVTARQGGGLRVNGQAFRRPDRSPVRLIALGENDFELGEATDQRAQRLRDEGYAVVRYRCAVFSLINVALGRLDGYIEHDCGLWDIAAAWVICAEAGVPINVQVIAPGRYAVEARWPSNMS